MPDDTTLTTPDPTEPVEHHTPPAPPARPLRSPRWKVAAAGGAVLLAAAGILVGVVAGRRWPNPPHQAGSTVVHAAGLSIPAGTPCAVTVAEPLVRTELRWPQFAARVHNPCQSVAMGVAVLATPTGPHHPTEQTAAVNLLALMPGESTVVSGQFGPAAEGNAPTVSAATASVQVAQWLPRPALRHPPADAREVCQLLATDVTITLTHQHPDHGWVYTTVTLHAGHWPKQNHHAQQVVMAAVGAHGQLLGAAHTWVFPNEPHDRTSMVWPHGTRRLVAYWQPNVQ